MNRQEFKKEAKETIDDLFKQMDKLERKVREAEGEAKTAIEDKLEDLRQQKEELTDKLKQLEQTSEKNWEMIKESFSNSVKAFKKTMAQ
jgi:flagellar biosynthesis/type III secretory pathway chaperone